MKKWFLFALLIVTLPQASVPVSTGYAAEGELNDFGRGSWKAILQAHAGQSLVVHIWGVTCGPCRVEMPQWGELLKERHDLNLVMIDADLVPNEPTAVTAMLSQSGLTKAESWKFSDGFVERLRYEIDPQWHGEIPLTFLIGRDGVKTKTEGVADMETIRAWLDAQARVSK
jgi:thiol-disulfide isomerase/thioredoxin